MKFVIDGKQYDLDTDSMNKRILEYVVSNLHKEFAIPNSRIKIDFSKKSLLITAFKQVFLIFDPVITHFGNIFNIPLPSKIKHEDIILRTVNCFSLIATEVLNNTTLRLLSSEIIEENETINKVYSGELEFNLVKDTIESDGSRLPVQT